MIAATGSSIDQWHLSDQPGNARAATAAEVAAHLQTLNIEATRQYGNLSQAFNGALDACGPQDLLVVFGSFFTVAAVRPQLDDNNGNP